MCHICNLYDFKHLTLNLPLNDLELTMKWHTFTSNDLQLYLKCHNWVLCPKTRVKTCVKCMPVLCKKAKNRTKELTKDADSETGLRIEGYRTQFLSPDVTLFSFSSRSGRDDKRDIFLDNVCYHSRDKSFEVYFWSERYDKNIARNEKAVQFIIRL